jgi:N-acetylmuramic acid 6-phosphate (MurNAc-6-P) etherase
MLVMQELISTVSLTLFSITLGKAYNEPMLNISPTPNFFRRLSRRLEIQGIGKAKMRKSSMMLKAAPAYIKAS